MVTSGVTLLLPVGATVPMPWLMLTEVVSVVVQLKVVLAPSVRIKGLAVMLAVGSTFTMTVAVAVLWP